MPKLKPLINYWSIILLWTLHANANVDALEYGTKVDDFVRQLTSLFNQHAISYREKDLDTNYLNTIKQHFSNIPDQHHPHGQTHRPFYESQSGLPPPATSSGHRPPPNQPDDYVDPYQSPDLLPTYPQKPPPYRPPFGLYSQTSLVTALSSIAQYDDLHCVPRLLCEVTSGSNITAGNENGKDNVSPIPFLRKDAVIALLTVLNFVDDSPILLFVRAAFLGYTSKGDAKVCLNGYPLCPKDPDQLVNYLNNHNGGFFRFFNQQLQQQPHYSHHVKKYLDKKVKNLRNLKLSPREPKFGFSSRILNDPIEIEEVASYGKISSSNAHLPQAPQNSDYNKFVFSTKYRLQTDPNDVKEDETEQRPDAIFTSRRGKKVSFPDRLTKSFKTDVMIFPDRTGTGNLILSNDPSVGLKISFADDLDTNSESKVKFSYASQKYGKKLRFPADEK